MSNKRRTMTVGIFSSYVRERWANPELVLEDNRDDVARRVVIQIDRPSDIAYLREQLDKIEKYWRAQLDTLKSS